MDKYGFEIIIALVTDIRPAANVMNAMNEINASSRLRCNFDLQAHWLPSCHMHCVAGRQMPCIAACLILRYAHSPIVAFIDCCSPGLLAFALPLSLELLTGH